MAFTAADPTPGPQEFSSERDALGRVLQSGIFDRAPNLEQILRYVCQKHFEGRIDEIKEYNIALDALRRPPGFDQKKDSIVRVEAHRLRKRLAEYYAGPGHADPVEITIPAGTYVPRFVPRQMLVAAPVEAVTPEPTVAPALPSEPVTIAELPPRPAPRAHFPYLWVAALAVTVCAAAAVATLGFRTPAETNPVAPAPALRSVPDSDGIRILAGSDRERMLDHLGKVWLADQFVTGGDIRTSSPRLIYRSTDPSLFQTRREGDFQYDIPVKPGFHEVRLHFAETVFGEGNIAGGGETSRIFAIRLNDAPSPEVVDVISNAGGPNTAWTRVFRGVQPMADGKIHIRFTPYYKEIAFLNGLEIVPTPDARMRPIRILAAGTPYIDHQRQQWNPDQYFIGGQPVVRHEAVAGTPEPELFRGERFGNFTYALPVDPKSHYTLNLRFAESWFGPGRPGGDAAPGRLFDVFCGGRSLLRKFNILKEAGGPLRAVTRTFHGLEPNAQGLLLLQFVPVENYALINSIEVIDEGR